MNGLPVPTNGHHPRFQINTNTGVSLGIIVLMFAGFFGLMNAINAMKTEIIVTRSENKSDKAETIAEVKKVDARVVILEGNKNSVTTTEFFRWAVHLQQSNPNIKVPEPEVAK